MRFCLTTLIAAAAFSLWASWHSNGTALASSGFTGSWCGNSRNAYMIADFPQLVIKQGMSVVTSAHYNLNGAQLVADRWGQTATLNSNGNKLHWSDGSVWERAIYGTQFCATFAATGHASAPSPTYRNLSFVTVALAHPIAPLGYWNVWTAMSTSSNVGYTCLSFKNTSNVTATRVLFSLSLMNEDGQVVDAGRIDRKGTFSPNVEIHGWHSIEEHVQHKGPRDYSLNCAKWVPDNHTQAQAYPHVRSYNVHAERIEYADGTVWPSESASPAPSASPSKRVRER